MSPAEDLTPWRGLLVKLKLQGYKRVWVRALQALHVACPECGAPPGTFCDTTKSGGDPLCQHIARGKAAQLPDSGNTSGSSWRWHELE